MRVINDIWKNLEHLNLLRELSSWLTFLTILLVVQISNLYSSQPQVRCVSLFSQMCVYVYAVCVCFRLSLFY